MIRHRNIGRMKFLSWIETSPYCFRKSIKITFYLVFDKFASYIIHLYLQKLYEIYFVYSVFLVNNSFYLYCTNSQICVEIVITRNFKPWGHGKLKTYFLFLLYTTMKYIVTLLRIL
jgi:hypothetical protein